MSADAASANAGHTERSDAAYEATWGWRPPLPLEEVPVFVWPPRPREALKYLASLGFMGSLIIPFTLSAALAWYYLQPPLESCVELRADWILYLFARNLGMMLLVAGGLHLYFHTFKRQGPEQKYDRRALDRSNRKFFASNQVWDNMLYTCASGVTVWTAYEVLFFWAYANDWLPFYLDPAAHPVWFVLVLVFAIPFWTSMHFYFVHRLLHWRPLYRIAHAVHHRNDNLGPWSGLSMHPIEHVLYFSSVLIHVLFMTHPIHILFHMQWNALGAITSHTGFESLLVRSKPVFILGSFHHQLHHRHYDCNYGNPFMPWDKWFGSDHDGTPEAWAEIRRRRRERVGPARA